MPYLNTLAREAMPPMAGQQWNPIHNFDRSQYRGSNFPRDTGLFGNSREGVLDGTAQAPIGTTKGINVGNTVHGTHTRYDFDVTPMLDAPSLTSFTFIADFEWTRPSSGILWLMFHISQLGAPTGVYDSLIYIMASVNQLRLGFNNGTPTYSSLNGIVDTERRQGFAVTWDGTDTVETVRFYKRGMPWGGPAGDPAAGADSRSLRYRAGWDIRLFAAPHDPPDATWQWPPGINFIKIYPRVLSQTEIIRAHAGVGGYEFS